MFGKLFVIIGTCEFQCKLFSAQEESSQSLNENITTKQAHKISVLMMF